MLVKFKQNIYKLLELIPLFKFTILPYYQFIKYKRKTLKTIIPNLKKQLIFTKPHNGFEHKKGPIVTFVWMETEHYGMYAMLILAKALQVRGADVNILVCNQTLPTCECMDIDNYRTDVCRICKLNQEHLLPLFNVKTTYLGEYISQEKIEELKQRAQEVIKYYPAKYMYHGIDLIPIVQSSIMRHYYGSWPESEKEFAELRYKHLLTAMITTNVSIGLKEKINPDIIIGQTWVYSMYAPFYQYFKISQNQKVLTLGMGGYHYKAFVLNDIDTFHSKDGFYQYLKAKNHKSLDEKERLSLRKFMDERFYGVSDYHKDHGEFKNNKEIEDLIGIDKRKKNIFLFPNLFWDAAYDLIDSSKVPYKDVVSWVLSTVDILKDNSNINLYIKPHIREKYGTNSKKGISDFIKEKYPALPYNVKIIPPEKKINSYELFPYIDLGIVYTSTIGIEMIYKAVPVVIAGPAQYGSLGFAYEPKTVDEYRNILFSKENKLSLDKELFEQFCHYFFIKRHIPFTLTDRVFSNGLFARYNMKSLDEILPGKNYFLDHLCNCILNDKLPTDYEEISLVNEVNKEVNFHPSYQII